MPSMACRQPRLRLHISKAWTKAKRRRDRSRPRQHMTVICPGGGPSGIKPGVGPNVVVSAGLITGGLALISPWLIPVAALVDGFLYNATTNCATDPPAMPTWTVADIGNLLGGVFNPNYQPSLQKLIDTVNNYMWYQFCQCTPGPPAVPFTPHAIP